MQLLQDLSRRIRSSCHVALARYAEASFAQEGEDRVAMRLLGTQTSGVFVDVGAHHPFRFSNTYAFYLRGWRGLNIDATPGSMRKFNRWRPGDINLELGIANTPGELEFYQFAEPALNTFDPALAQTYREGGFAQVGKTAVRCRTLADVLEDHLGGRAIDFLTVDVEGHDVQVLLSNDWVRFRPRLCLVEQLDCPAWKVPTTTEFKIMAERGYTFVAKSLNTSFYMTDDWSGRR